MSAWIEMINDDVASPELIYLLNGHGANLEPARQVIKSLNMLIQYSCLK